MFIRPRRVALQFSGWILLACSVCCVAAQDPLLAKQDSLLTFLPPGAVDKQSKRKPSVNDSPPPDTVIPVTPLGFAPPAVHYLGDRLSLVSLNFLGEDSLLFTFRVPGLIPRQHNQAGESPETPRHIRAVLLSLPTGKVTAEAVWEVHDQGQYLWGLSAGKFLLRDRNTVELGDSSLHMEPFLRFPGQVRYLELDPQQRLLVANTSEPPAPAPKTDAASPPTAATASVASSGHLALDRDAPDGQATVNQDLIRVLRLDTRAVMLFSRVAGVTHLALDGEGYYEALRGSGSAWVIAYQDFHGASIPMLTVESTCYPSLEVLAPNTVLVSACTPNAGRKLIAVHRAADGDGKAAKGKGVLWEQAIPPTRVWPLISSAPEGLRFARATLDVTHPIGLNNPLDREDIRGQNVQVYDVATGKVALAVASSPVLDGGGNFALSPSGQRFAVLHEGTIEVFNLPPAPPLPAPPRAKP